MKCVELELEDCDYTLWYRWTPVMPATRVDPEAGGIEVTRIAITVASGITLDVPADKWERLQVYDELVERAYAEEESA